MASAMEVAMIAMTMEATGVRTIARRTLRTLNVIRGLLKEFAVREFDFALLV